MHIIDSLPLGRAAQWARRLIACIFIGALAACATTPPPDYTAFKKSRPASLLVLPPLNDSPELLATYGVLSQVTLPLAEGGYYVIPVSLMDETFRQNGLHNPAEMHQVPAAKLREIFGADAAVYITIKRYGTSYAVLSSDTTVTVEGRVIDLRNGQTLWQGSASASSSEENSQSGGGLAGMLIKAVVMQIVGTVNDHSFKYAGIASRRLLGPRKNGLLFGPRSPEFGKD